MTVLIAAEPFFVSGHCTELGEKLCFVSGVFIIKFYGCVITTVNTKDITIKAVNSKGCSP